MRRLLVALTWLVLACPVARAEAVWQTLPTPPPLPTPERTGKAAVDDIEMFYAVYGSGPPVLFIHGGLGNADAWGFQVPAFAKDHTVVVADSRGHGRSTRSAKPFGYALMADDYLALMSQLGFERFALVGWSDGGIIGLDIAIRHPERLTGVFAFAANTTPEGVDPAVETNATFGRYIELMGEQYKKISPTPDQYDAFVEQISQMWASQPNYTKAQLQGITVPVTVFDGDHDEAILRAHTEEIAATIPGAKLVILPEASHFAMWQQPQAFNAAVRTFLDGL
jgi:pimeloyl-ACP methyl ester carboxylesterase